MTKKPEAERDVAELVQQALVPEEEQPYKVLANWVWVRLQCVAGVYGGKRLPAGHQLVEHMTKYPYVRVTDFSDGTIDVSGLKYIEQNTYEIIRHYTIARTDIYISIAGTIGKVGIIPDMIGGANLTENAAKISDIKIDQRFLFRLLSSEELQKQIRASTKATTQAKLALYKIADLIIPVPPLPEQQRIVNVIESLFAKLDRARELLEEVQDAFEEQKATILARAFRGELTARWRAGRGLKFEKEWKKEPLENLCDSVSDGDHQPPPQTEAGVPFLVISNITSGEVDFSDTRFVSIDYYNSLSDKRRPKLGDILYSVTGSFGIPAMVKDDSPFCFQRHIALIRPNRIDNTYLYYFLQNPEVYQEISSIATGVAQLTVPIRGLRQLSVPVPPKEEQQEIVRILDDLLDKTSAAASLCDQMEQIDQLKKTILAKAFRGELVTNDPAEESAEKLLREVLRKRAVEQDASGRKKRIPQLPKAIEVEIANVSLENIVRVSGKLSSDQLFKQSRIKDIQEFYSKLKEALESGKIIEKRDETGRNVFFEVKT